MLDDPTSLVLLPVDRFERADKGTNVLCWAKYMPRGVELVERGVAREVAREVPRVFLLLGRRLVLVLFSCTSPPLLLFPLLFSPPDKACRPRWSTFSVRRNGLCASTRVMESEAEEAKEAKEAEETEEAEEAEETEKTK